MRRTFRGRAVHLLYHVCDNFFGVKNDKDDYTSLVPFRSDRAETLTLTRPGDALPPN